MTRKQMTAERRAKDAQNDAEFKELVAGRIDEVRKMVDALDEKCEALGDDGFRVKITIVDGHVTLFTIGRKLPSGIWHRFI